MPLSGKYINTLVRKDGQWRIAGNMAMQPVADELVALRNRGLFTL